MTKNIKNANVVLDIDAVDPNALGVLADVLVDFNMLSSIHIHSKRLSPPILQKFWAQQRKMQKLYGDGQADFFTFKKMNLWNSIRQQTVAIVKKPTASDPFNFEITVEPDVQDFDIRTPS